MGLHKQDIIDYELSQVGYLEKKSNSQLDDKTANAGMNNYTKYGRDYDKIMGTKLNGLSWCAMFQSVCFVKAYGETAAKKLLGGNLFASTKAGAVMTGAADSHGRNKHPGRKPKVGDLVFFYSNSMGRISHIGFVYNVDSNRFYTVEGNTSSKAGVVRNGGAVEKKSYPLSQPNARFAELPYAKVNTDKKKDAKAATKKKTAKKTSNIFTNNNAKNPYKLKATTIKAGSDKNSIKWLQFELNQWKSSLVVDGIWGTNTKNEVMKFQKAHDLTADGIAGPKTIAALKKDK